jgi:hypothetical protein
MDVLLWMLEIFSKGFGYGILSHIKVWFESHPTCLSGLVSSELFLSIF